ncbi:MAG: hypothetical protein ACYDAR_13430 [Thermomicrobiales bacterium]
MEGPATIVATQGAIRGQANVTVVAPTPLGIRVPPAPQGRPSGTTSGEVTTETAPAPAPTGR